MITNHYHYHKDNNVKFDIQYMIYINKNVGMTQKALSYIQNRPHNDYPHHRFIFWFFWFLEARGSRLWTIYVIMIK